MEKTTNYMSIVKVAQYLANVTINQDFNSELCHVISTFFEVEVAAVAEKNLKGAVMVHDCWKGHVCSTNFLLQQVVVESVMDVLATGLLKEEILPGAVSITLFFIPIEVEKKVTAVLIIGHHKINPAEIKNILNEYLAVARLAGTIRTRIVYEKENIQRKSNEKFRLLFDSSRDPILLLDKTACIIECNEAAIQMLGARSKDEVLMRQISRFAPKNQPDGRLSSRKEELLLAKVLATGHAQYEWVIERLDGTELIVDAKMNTIVMDDNKVQLVHWRDITRRKRIEEELQYLNKMLENKMYQLQEINTALEEEIAERQAVEEALHRSRDELAATNSELKSFAGIIAHDFRAPMVNLKGFSKELSSSLSELQQILKDNVTYLPEKVQKQVDILIDKEVPEELMFIYSSVDRLSRMIDVLLQLGSIGRRELNYKVIDISSLVTAVLHSYNNLIEKNDIQVEMGLFPQIVTDQVAMEQIIGNLVDNAIKYLEPGRRGKITISCKEEDDSYLFSVQDNGRGIAIADQGMIFEIFRRAGKQDAPGEGMGLAYVKTLVRQMDGRVCCQSELGVGTRMHVIIPKKTVA